MGSRGAKCSRLGDGNEYADVIEIGGFAHAQHSSAALIIDLRNCIWDKDPSRSVSQAESARAGREIQVISSRRVLSKVCADVPACRIDPSTA